MQIVIDIPEYIYNLSQSHGDIVYKYIAKGTPLPKGHGDLIDRNKIEYLKAIHDMKWGEITASECATKIKYSAPTIIEADKAESEGEE